MRYIRIERCEILRTSASRKTRSMKREKENEDRKTEREREREPTHGKNKEGKKGTTQAARGHAYAWRVCTYARSRGRLALENVKPTDSPIYRPPSEFAVRAFRKTFAALGDRREGRARAWKSDGNRAAQGRIPLPTYARSPSERSDIGRHAFLAFLVSLPRPQRFLLARSRSPSKEKDGRRKKKRQKERERERSAKERARETERAPGVRPISRVRGIFYSPIFESRACYEL